MKLPDRKGQALTSQAQNEVVNQEEDPEEIARMLGIPRESLTNAMLIKIADDPLYLHHLELCKGDPEMFSLFLGAENGSDVPPGIRTSELLSRASFAMARWAAAGFRRVSDETYRNRMISCQSCEHLSLPPKNKLYRLTGIQHKSVCALCGCDVRRKAWLPTEVCPASKWGVEN